MPANTNVRLQNEVIYSVFVRDHTQEGTFRALIGDLPRIHALGCDIVWLLPIHPLGEKNCKGSLGSPYANRDYRGINPEYGTMEDFRALVDAIHTEGMRCMIDVVYHHTSPDSVLWEAHPEWFYRKPDGRPGNHVGDWSDVVDLDFDQPALWDYLIETLVGWARVVDGFRCDVASLVPVGFWERARRAVAEVNPDCVWLAETVHRSFGAEMRRRGLTYMSDTEGYRAFDIEYSYDIWETFERWLAGAAPLSHLLDLLDFQDSAYPTGFNKLRYLENHDQPRIASRVTDDAALRALTALIYFLKGTTLVSVRRSGVTTCPPFSTATPWTGRSVTTWRRSCGSCPPSSTNASVPTTCCATWPTTSTISPSSTASRLPPQAPTPRQAATPQAAPRPPAPRLTTPHPAATWASSPCADAAPRSRSTCPTARIGTSSPIQTYLSRTAA